MKKIPTPIVRANQWTVVVSVVFAAVLRQPLLLLIPWSAAMSGLLGGPRWQPVFRLARPLLASRLAGAHGEDAGAQRFNALLACLLLTVALTALLALDAPRTGWTAAAAVGLAAFAAIRGHCIGCAIYGWLPVGLRQRIVGRGVPEARS